uniref:Peptidase A1 domain-containing protein n=1 Tax=Ditylenchus dipsaci TaxID=166011 RepID=A0A915DNE2_9BILA
MRGVQLKHWASIAKVIPSADSFWSCQIFLSERLLKISFSVSDDIPAKNTFNSSQSSTLTDLNLNFTSWYGNGFVANDILALGDTLKSKVDFGLLDSPIGWFLDEPVITIWTNNSADGNGSSVGTLGAVDTEHCQSNWIYVPQDSNKYYPYSFHVSSVELTLNGTKQQLGLNKTMVVDQYVDSMYLPASLKPWFVNATNAIYDSNSGYYKVDCDISKAAKLVFNIGGKGNTTSSANKQLVISAADYVAYSESSDICYLATYFSKHLSVLEMNIQFSNNHCIAYNIKDNTIGIADSKTPITDVEQLNK